MLHRILLADDEPVTLQMMKFAFERLGYDVVCAADGEEAWTVIGQLRPDIVLTDFQMPRLDGLGLAARVKNTAETAGIPIVMATYKALEMSADQTRQEYGIAALLPKPYNPRTYASVIKGVLESRAVGVQ